MKKGTGNQTMPHESTPIKAGSQQPPVGTAKKDRPRFEQASPQQTPLSEEAIPGLPSKEPGAEKTIFTHRELVTGPLEPVYWRVEKLIPADGVVVIGGDSGVGKSWFTQHIAQCVGAGEPVLGHFDTKQGTVVYVDEESSPHLLKRRIQKLSTGLPLREDIPVTFLINRGVRIDRVDSLEDLLAVLEEKKPKLVIFDSFIRIHSKNENDSREMSEVHATLRTIQKTLRCAIVVTHHARKRSMFNQAGEMLRGSTDIRAFADGHLFIRKGQDKTRKKIEHEKSRYCEPLDPFEIEIVDNEDETATFVRYVGQAQAPKAPREIAKELILDMLKEEGPLPRQVIIERCKGQAGSKAVGQALNELYDGLVVQRDVGSRGGHIYRLPERSAENLAAVFRAHESPRESQQDPAQ